MATGSFSPQPITVAIGSFPPSAGGPGGGSPARAPHLSGRYRAATGQVSGRHRLMMPPRCDQTGTGCRPIKRTGSARLGTARDGRRDGSASARVEWGGGEEGERQRGPGTAKVPGTCSSTDPTHLPITGTGGGSHDYMTGAAATSEGGRGRRTMKGMQSSFSRHCRQPQRIMGEAR